MTQGRPRIRRRGRVARTPYLERTGAFTLACEAVLLLVAVVAALLFPSVIADPVGDGTGTMEPMSRRWIDLMVGQPPSCEEDSSPAPTRGFSLP